MGAGIPATVGGAVATNAGAFGADLAGLAVALTLLMPDGTVRQVAGAEVPHAYRRRELPAGSVVLAARLAFTRSDPDTVAARAAEYLKRRKATQPLGSRTAGSVFKNPPGDHAGRLIEAAGCKGLTVGDAVVSERHANVIGNRGRARAADIQGLIQLVASGCPTPSGSSSSRRWRWWAMFSRLGSSLGAACRPRPPGDGGPASRQRRVPPPASPGPGGPLSGRGESGRAGPRLATLVALVTVGLLAGYTAWPAARASWCAGPR